MDNVGIKENTTRNFKMKMKLLSGKDFTKKYEKIKIKIKPIIYLDKLKSKNDPK
jgi:hypothetical protein